MIKWKEVAKFLAGVAANQTLTHGVFALKGDLPLQILGVAYTRELNIGAVIFWLIVLVLLVTTHGFVNDQFREVFQQ